MTQETSRLQPAFTHAMAEALRLANETSHADMKQARHDERVEFAKFLEKESVESIEQMIGHMLDTDELPEETKKMVESMLKPEHPVQIAALVAILARLAWDFAGAYLSGPMSRVQTISMRNFGDYKPAPDFAANAAARDRITRELAEAWKNDNGFTEVDLEEMIKANQQTLPVGMALDLLRREEIDEARFFTILTNNALDLDSQVDVAKLRFGPPSAADAINAVTQNQLTPEQAKAFMALNGLDPANYEWLYETNGRSPGVDWLNRLYNYELISEELYEAGLLESPIKNKYVPALKNSRFRRPPMEQTLSMLRRGVIDKETGLRYMKYLGYFPDDAEKLVEWAMKGKAEGTKDLSVANVRAMYAEGLLTKDDAAARIGKLGFDTEETTLMLEYADAVRKRQRSNMAINRVRTQYVGRKISDTQAVGALDALKVAPEIRNDLIADWTVEHEITVRHLTVAEIMRASKDDLLRPEEVQSRLLAMGYSESDTGVLMELNNVPLTGAGPLKDLTVAQIIKAVKKEVITRADAERRLVARGYDAADVKILLDSQLGEES